MKEPKRRPFLCSAESLWTKNEGELYSELVSCYRVPCWFSAVQLNWVYTQNPANLKANLVVPCICPNFPNFSNTRSRSNLPFGLASHILLLQIILRPQLVWWNSWSKCDLEHVRKKSLPACQRTCKRRKRPAPQIQCKGHILILILISFRVLFPYSAYYYIFLVWWKVIYINLVFGMQILVISNISCCECVLALAV